MVIWTAEEVGEASQADDSAMTATTIGPLAPSASAVERRGTTKRRGAGGGRRRRRGTGFAVGAAALLLLSSSSSVSSSSASAFDLAPPDDADDGRRESSAPALANREKTLRRPERRRITAGLPSFEERDSSSNDAHADEQAAPPRRTGQGRQQRRRRRRRRNLQDSGDRLTNNDLTNNDGVWPPSPTEASTSQPAPAPTTAPVPRPTPNPTPAPTTGRPTPSPTPAPTSPPTPGPTPQPTLPPVPDVTPGPTLDPTPRPTPNPTPRPRTSKPTPDPTPAPTGAPTTPTPTTPRPTSSPVNYPTTAEPTKAPTPGPTREPTPEPTGAPTSPPAVTAAVTPQPTTAPAQTPAATTGTPTTGPDEWVDSSNDDSDSGAPTSAPTSAPVAGTGELGGGIAPTSSPSGEDGSADADVVSLNIARPLPPSVLTLTFPEEVVVLDAASSPVNASSNSSSLFYADPSLLATELDVILTSYLSSRLGDILGDGDDDEAGGLLSDLTDGRGEGAGAKGKGFLEFSRVELTVLPSSKEEGDDGRRRRWLRGLGATTPSSSRRRRLDGHDYSPHLLHLSRREVEDGEATGGGADKNGEDGASSSASFDLAGMATLVYATPMPVILPTGLQGAVNASINQTFDPAEEERLAEYIRERSSADSALGKIKGASVRVATDGSASSAGDGDGAGSDPGGDAAGIRNEGGDSGGRKKPSLWAQIIAYVLIGIGAVGLMGYAYVFYHRRKVINGRKKERARRAEVSAAAARERENNGGGGDPLGTNYPSIVRTNSDDCSVQTYGVGSGNPSVDKEGKLSGSGSVLGRLSISVPMRSPSVGGSSRKSTPVAAGAVAGQSALDSDEDDSYDSEDESGGHFLGGGEADDDSFARELESAAGVDEMAWKELEERKQSSSDLKQSLEWGQEVSAEDYITPFASGPEGNDDGGDSEGSVISGNNAKDTSQDNDDGGSSTTSSRTSASSKEGGDDSTAANTDASPPETANPAMYYPAKQMMGMETSGAMGMSQSHHQSAMAAAAAGVVVGAGNGYVAHSDRHIECITEGEDESAVSSQLSVISPTGDSAIPSLSSVEDSSSGADNSSASRSTAARTKAEADAVAASATEAAFQFGMAAERNLSLYLEAPSSESSNPGVVAASSDANDADADAAVERELSVYLGERDRVQARLAQMKALAASSSSSASDGGPAAMPSPSTVYSDPSVQEYSSSADTSGAPHQPELTSAGPEAVPASVAPVVKNVRRGSGRGSRRNKAASPAPSFSAFSDPSLVAYSGSEQMSGDEAAAAGAGFGSVDPASRPSAVLDKNLRMASATALAVAGQGRGSDGRGYAPDEDGREGALSPAFLAGWGGSGPGMSRDEGDDVSGSSATSHSSSERSPTESSQGSSVFSSERPSTDVGVKSWSGLGKMESGDERSAERDDSALLLEESGLHFVPALAQTTSSESPCGQSTEGEDHAVATSNRAVGASGSGAGTASFDASSKGESSREWDSDGKAALPEVVSELRRVSKFVKSYEQSRGVFDPSNIAVDPSESTATSDGGGGDITRTLEELHRLSAVVASGRFDGVTTPSVSTAESAESSRLLLPSGVSTESTDSRLLPAGVSTESSDSRFLAMGVSTESADSKFLQSEVESFYSGGSVTNAAPPSVQQRQSMRAVGDQASFVSQSPDRESVASGAEQLDTSRASSGGGGDEVSGSRLGIVPFAVAKRLDSKKKRREDDEVLPPLPPAAAVASGVNEGEDCASPRKNGSARGKPPRSKSKNKKTSTRSSLLSVLRKSDAMLDAEGGGEPSSLATQDGMSGAPPPRGASPFELPPSVDVDLANANAQGEEEMHAVVTPRSPPTDNVSKSEGRNDPPVADEQQQSETITRKSPTRMSSSLVRKSKDLITFFEARRSPASGPIMPPSENWQYNS